MGPAQHMTLPYFTKWYDFIMFALHLFYFSMGCGIGYGYLHRIPIKDPSELPPQLKASPAPDGFSDVR